MTAQGGSSILGVLILELWLGLFKISEREKELVLLNSVSRVPKLWRMERTMKRKYRGNSFQQVPRGCLSLGILREIVVAEIFLFLLRTILSHSPCTPAAKCK